LKAYPPLEPVHTLLLWRDDEPAEPALRRSPPLRVLPTADLVAAPGSLQYALTTPTTPSV